MRQKISNPHDEATIECSDWIAACLAVLFVGEGKYGIMGEKRMPVFILGGAEEWIKQEFRMGLEEAIETVGYARIADALETMNWEHEWSSLTDFVGYGHKIAETLRTKAQKEVRA